MRNIKMTRPHIVNQLVNQQEPLKKLTIRLDVETHEKLKVQCAKLRVSIQDHIKKMILQSLG